MDYFYASAAGRLDPGASVTMPVEALSASAAQSLAGMIPSGGLLTVMSEMRPVGMRQNDQVVGGPIDLPIDLCNGCLTKSMGTCPLPMGTPVADPCFPQQDVAQTCCDMAGTLVCGTAAVATM
jgi:hypothetical protein